jgi:hypothetical protein
VRALRALRGREGGEIAHEGAGRMDGEKERMEGVEKEGEKKDRKYEDRRGGYGGCGAVRRT